MANGYAPGSGSPEQDARLELRVSHADRDRVVETLTAASSEGLLAADELDDRVEAALSARTRGELAVLIAGLPPSGIERQAKDLIRIDQRFGDVTRAGQWVVPRRMEIKLTAGDVTLDFTREGRAADCDTAEVHFSHAMEDRTTRHARAEGGTLDHQASYAVTTWLSGHDDGS